MNNFKNIQSKLQEFVKKYYTNELIKGLILFCSFGLLYFIFTLLIEHFLWLQPTARTILFWMFIVVEVALLIRYIFLPIFKLFGIQKGITLQTASKIIGNHFNEVDDKLLNILQLNEDSNQSELLLASIDQKAKNLQPIPFNRAIDFTSNKKHLKFLAIPIAIWLITYFTGNTTLFSDSYERVMHPQLVYEPPAPFSFEVLNENLSVIEGEGLNLMVETTGKVTPEDAKIHFSDQNYYLQNQNFGQFEYTFSSIKESFDFYLSSNNVRSRKYTVKVINSPIITGLELVLNFPSHTRKTNEKIKNTGNVIVPQGTNITWKVKARNTNEVTFEGNNKTPFDKKSDNTFELKKRIQSNLEYKISTSNNDLKEYENLDFTVEVVKDQFPSISIKTDIDSISLGPVQFAGQLSDDYGVSKLQLVYYDINNKNNKNTLPISISKSTFEEFYYVFPKGIDLIAGVDYEMFFEVYDNDVVNGSKKSKSKAYSYYKKTEKEVKEQLLEDQEKSIENLTKSLEKSKKVKEEFQKMQQSLQNKSSMNWNDQKKLQSFIERQQQYEKMMQRQAEEIQKNLEEQPVQKNESLEKRKEDIQKRLQEVKDLAKQEKLLEELKELTDKLQKEELTDKIKKLTNKNKQNEKSLERILELTKRFYVEQKANQIKEKLDDLAKKQEELAKNEENSSEKQKKLNKEFNELKKEMDQLEKDNKDLKKPMDLPKTGEDEKSVDQEQKEATDKLEEGEKENLENSHKSDSKKSASNNQKSAAQKMKKMSGMMGQSMQQSEEEGEQEDINALRAIVENLIEFSFQQEDLLEGISMIDNAHPEFANKLKKQHVLKEYFEHIDDSLYTLSMRQPKISSKIFKHLSDAHYHLDESLIHLADNKLNVGVSDQQFVMTATNNLANLLSNSLNSMQNASPGMGSAKKKGESFSLPDIIQKQGEMIEKMKDGIKPGEKSGEKKGGKEGEKPGENGQKSGEGEGEQMNGELYEIYKEQAQMRKMLEDALDDKKGGGKVVEDVLKKMEQLERDLLEKGFNKQTLHKMLQMKHELLKLKKAAQKQGQDNKRESNSNTQEFEKRSVKSIKGKKLRFRQDEILNRQSLPLQTIYKKKVQEYFKVNDSIQ